MSKLIIPKELNPKTKISFINIMNLFYTLPIVAVPYYSKTFFGLEGILIDISIFICLLFVVYATFDDKKYGNRTMLLFNSINYLIDYKQDKTYLYPNKSVKIIRVIDKKGNEKTIKKSIELDEEEKVDFIYKINDVKEFDYDDEYGVGWYIKTTKKYITYLSLEIDLLPTKEYNDNSKLNSMESFENIIMAQENCTLKILTSHNDLEVYAKEIDKIEHSLNVNEKSKFGFLLRLKRNQIKRAKNLPSKKYILKLEANKLQELNALINSIKNEYNFTSSRLLSEEEFNEHLLYSMDSNINTKYYSDHIYNENCDVYERFILVNSLSTLQDYYYIQNLATYNYDIQIKFKKVENQKIQINKAYSEIKSRSKYDRTLTGDVESHSSKNEIIDLYQNINTGNKCLFKMELLIKIDGYSLDELNKNTTNFLKESFIKNNFDISQGFFKQNILAKSFYEINNNKFNTEYVISSSNVAGGYPFNYKKILQKGGILHNANNSSVLALNYHQVDSSNNQSSYNFIVGGGMGSGKSSLLKEMTCEEIMMKKARVIMFDFDNETIGLVNQLDGNMIIPGITKINLLEILVDPNKTDKENRAKHITDVTSFFNIVYPNWNDKIISLFISTINNYYDVSLGNSTLNGYLDFIKNELDLNVEIEKDLFNYISDFVLLNQSYSEISDSAFNFDSELTSISFSQVKNSPNFQAHLFWIIKYSNYKITLNRLDNACISYTKEKFSKYIDDYTIINKIKTPLLEELLNEFLKNDNGQIRGSIIKEINNQMKFIRIVIDECHRALHEPETRRFIELMSREARKYFAGITLADQTIKNFLNDNTNDSLLATIWSNTNYKIFLKLGDEDISLLLDKKYVTKQQIQPILKNPAKGKGVLVLQKGDVIDWHSILTTEAIDLFGGGK